MRYPRNGIFEEQKQSNKTEILILTGQKTPPTGETQIFLKRLPDGRKKQATEQALTYNTRYKYLGHLHEKEVIERIQQNLSKQHNITEIMDELIETDIALPTTQEQDPHESH